MVVVERVAVVGSRISPEAGGAQETGSVMETHHLHSRPRKNLGRYQRDPPSAPRLRCRLD